MEIETAIRLQNPVCLLQSWQDKSLEIGENVIVITVPQYLGLVRFATKTNTVPFAIFSPNRFQTSPPLHFTCVERRVDIDEISNLVWQALQEFQIIAKVDRV